MSKARKIDIPLVQELIDETTPLQKRQVRDRISLAKKIDELIKSKFGSYTSFAKHIKRSPTEVSRWVSGTHNLTQATLSEIAMGLGVELTELFTKRELSQPIIISYTMDSKEIQRNAPIYPRLSNPIFSIKID